MNSYEIFIKRFKLIAEQNPNIILNTMSNIFTMRLIGNKTHGDLGEIAITEFVNQFMYDYKAQHVGKDLFRAKQSEEDFIVESLVDESDEKILISLKAYGDGPLQLSTDKNALMFPFLEEFSKERSDSLVIDDVADVNQILENDIFKHFSKVNVMPLIYREADKKCNIMIFDFARALSKCVKVEKIIPEGRRVHPLWVFKDADNRYMFEVRYGGKTANALQRGLWTNTQKAEEYFISVTDGWLAYEHHKILVDLFAKALNADSRGHRQALESIINNISQIKSENRIP